MTIDGDQATIGLTRWWWTFLLRGGAAILFGVLALISPAWGLAILVVLFGAWALVDGVGSLIAGLRTRGQDRSWWLEVLEGLAGVVAAVVVLAFPAFAQQVLVLVIAAWAILTGAIEIVLAVRLRRVIRGEVWMVLAGAASILFGVLLVLFPAAGALGLVWLIGAFAIVFGAFEIGIGWRLRSYAVSA